MNDKDLVHLRSAIAVAQKARENGNHPFGAILVDEDNACILKAENSVLTEKDCTGHAETNLIRRASQKHSPEKLAGCTLYSSTEPCPMCSGAIYWSKVGRVVYALSARQLYLRTGNAADLRLPSGSIILEAGNIGVSGPALEDEAFEVHKGFWNR